MRYLFLALLLAVLFQGCSFFESKGSSVLIVVSNATQYGHSGLSTSNHFAEIILAYDEFEKAGYAVDFLSPDGGQAPLGYFDDTSEIENKYLNDGQFMERLKNTLSPQHVISEDYQAIYFAGGGAAMFGVPENRGIQKIAMDIYEKNDGIVSAVCHGSAGLAYLKRSNGMHLVDGKNVNGFPDLFENKEDAYYATFPFSIEQKLKENGGIFTYSEEGWDGYCIVDDRLITGQDPSAARSVAKKVIEQLHKQ